jgi:branched-chain amino acid transport system ATP-binding protein
VAANGAVLRVAGVDAGYGETQVLWGVSLEVQPGETVALIGSNGAGKSTLLGAVSGIVRVTAGRITLGETDLTNRSPDRIVAQGIVQVPQGRRLFGGLTVRENLLMGAYLRSDGDVEADLDRFLTMFPRIRERYEFLAGRLSGGEQQQVAIGRALMARPSVLLLDEMSLGLAPVLVDALLDNLAQINASGVAILMVEQDVQTALEFAQRAYVLETGRVTLCGAARPMLDDPQVKRAYLGV